MTIDNKKSKVKAALARFCVVALVSVLAVHNAAYAGQQNGQGMPSKSLAYDAGASTLLKLDNGELSRSDDQGRTWTAVPLPSLKGTLTSVAVAAKEDDIFYVAGPEAGILRTTDNGKHWVDVGEVLPSKQVTALAAHATEPDTLYASVAAEGIYRTQDAGKSWKLMDKGIDGIRQLLHTNMEGSMETGWLYAATTDGARVSMDCFCLWRDAGDLSGPVHSLTYDPRKPKNLFASTKQGVFESTDGGQAWKEIAPLPKEALALAVSETGRLYALASDGALFVSGDGAETWEAAGDR